MLKIIINSTLGLTSAFMITILLHEITHYITAISLGQEAMLFHNRVTAGLFANRYEEIMFSGLAPVFSLLQGILVYRWGAGRKKSTLTLFFLWLGIAGLVTFFGYLIIAPIMPKGDTGRVFQLLGVPMMLQVIIAALAIITITFILMRITPKFVHYAETDSEQLDQKKANWSLALILYPLLISILIVSLLQFPIPHIASVLATTCAPMAIMAIFGNFLGSDLNFKTGKYGKSLATSISKPLIIVLFIAVLVNRLLVYGI